MLHHVVLYGVGKSRVVGAIVTMPRHGSVASVEV